MKKTVVLMMAVLMVFAVAGAAFGSGEETGAGVKKATNESVNYFAMSVLAAALGVGIAAFGCGLGQGIATSKAAEGVARQPEAAGKIQNLLILGLAFIESLTIYALVIGIILIFMNPFKDLFVG